TAPTQFAFTTNPSGAGNSYSYQWFESNNGTSFTAISSATNNTYLSGNLIATKYYKVVVISQICGTTDTSNIITVTVRDEFIAGQIAGMDTICYNTIPNQLTMISNCTGGDVPYLYQWQQSSDNVNFSNIGSATNTTCQPTTLTQTTYYRLQFTSDSGCGVVYSNIIRDTVYPNIQAATITTTTINPICYNTIPTAISIQTPASGGNSIFNNQWQVAISGVWTDITGETSNSYQSEQLITTTRYRLKSTSDYGCGDIYSNVITITVYPQISAGVINGTQTICYNTAPTQFAFTTNPSGAGNSYSYQWYESNNGTSFTAISNVTNNTYLSGNLIATKYYKVVVTSKICGTTDTSNIITVTVRDEFIAGQINGMDTICYNTIPNQLTMTSNCTGGDVPYLYQWQQSFDNVNFSNIGSATNTTYQPTTLTQTTYYRLQFTSGNGCGVVYSNVIEIYVNPLPLEKELVGDLVVCRNSNDAHYSLSTSQENIDYQFTIVGGNIISNPNTDSITVYWDSIAGTGKLTLLQTNILTSCQLRTEFEIEITNSFSPNKTHILQKDNSNILICEDNYTNIHYEWGFINLATQEEQTITNSNYQYIQIPHVIDTTKYEYFVDIYYEEKSCLTRTYYPKNMVEKSLKNEKKQKITAFPNPAKKQLSISLNQDIKTDFTVVIDNILGQCVFKQNFSEYQANDIINLEFNLHGGVYILVVQNKVETLIQKIVIE
ncbi:MAG: T9SS type A sorting domain-containing protein, partial [Bacteroidales bacterium]|nr:T9SS type A sorting domain-containing protein [Bacteroidales bacterium]